MPNPNRSIYDFYNITDIIGEGTFSTVTVANDIIKKEDKYAIKIISKEVLDRERRTYVDWEISILSKCQHPNIIKFYEHFESEEDICLVLEWIPNGDLFDRIVKKGVFSEDEAKQAMKSLLSAVEYLHDKSVVHRDIKPENILYTTPKDIKLADFGLAKFYEESIGLELACGTLAYSAPEITNNQIYRKSVDMWSCGCILYFILFGRPPFYSDDEDVMFELVTKGQWSFPAITEHKYSDQVKDLIKSLLETDPNKRLTVKQSLNHPWIVNQSSSIDNDRSSFASIIRQSSSSGLSAAASSSSSSTSLKTIIEQQEYNYNHQQLHNNILHSSSSSNSHSINSSSNGGRHSSSNNNCLSPSSSSSLIDNNNHQHDEDNNNNNNNINSFSSIRHSIRNSNNININSSNNGSSSSIIQNLHRSFSRDDSDDDNNDSEDDNNEEDNSQQFSKYSQSSNNPSIRTSASKPIPIKKSQLRSSLNTSIDLFRGGLTPISK